jgi:hypothetical protein
MNELQRSVVEYRRRSNSGIKPILLISEMERKEFPAKMLNEWRGDEAR